MATFKNMCGYFKKENYIEWKKPAEKNTDCDYIYVKFEQMEINL